MGDNPSAFADCGDDCPVENITWNHTQSFIRRLNELEGGADYRLPTEAEWEYAVRAGRRFRFSFGNSDRRLDEYAWYSSNSEFRTHPVGKKKPNALGLYDMHGNVLEWCQDLYANYPSHLVTDPKGPPDGSHRVVRGGSWYDESKDVRSANRGLEPPTYGFHNVGFRVARTWRPQSLTNPADPLKDQKR